MIESSAVAERKWFPVGEKFACSEAFDRGTRRFHWSLNKQDKSISDDPLLQRVRGKARTFSTVLFLSLLLTENP